MIQTLRTTWTRITKVVAALEVGHAVLADQDDFDVDGITISLSRETIDMLRSASLTLTFLAAWEPHPAAPCTHDFMAILLQVVNKEARDNSTAYRNYVRDETLILYEPALRDCLTRFMMSITVLTQTECDTYFLNLCVAATNWYISRHWPGSCQPAVPFMRWLRMLTNMETTIEH